MKIKLKGALPKGDKNGLAGIEGRFQPGLKGVVPIAALVSVAQNGVDRTGAEPEDFLVLQVELIEALDADEGSDVLRHAQRSRTGLAELEGIDGGAA
jgi:hypothetical protein